MDKLPAEELNSLAHQYLYYKSKLKKKVTKAQKEHSEVMQQIEMELQSVGLNLEFLKTYAENVELEPEALYSMNIPVKQPRDVLKNLEID